MLPETVFGASLINQCGRYSELCLSSSDKAIPSPDSEYYYLRSIPNIEHPVRTITQSSSLIKCCPRQCLELVSSFSAKIVRSYVCLCPIKPFVHPSGNTKGLQDILYIEHPVCSIAQSCSLFKCCPRQCSDVRS